MTTQELIRNEIERLHSKNTGTRDWQRLMGQVDAAYKMVPYNTAQTIAVLIGAAVPTVKNIDLEWSRGTGKTTIFAHFTREIAQDLPRGCFQWEVPTYKKFLTDIIPSWIHALEMQGLYKDLHYFIGRKAPAGWNWPEQYKPPATYEHHITFWNGFGIALLSQDLPGTGRGLSTDGRLCDESVLLDPKKLDEDSGPSIRGSNVKALGNRRYFDFRMMASSTALTEKGAWFINREMMAHESPQKHRFIRANCVENIELGWLKPDYLTEAQRTSYDRMTFEAEYLNIRPKFVRGGFYDLLEQDQHGYTSFNYTSFYTPEYKPGAAENCKGDGDLVQGAALMLGMDFGAAINSLTVAQKLPAEIRVIKDFFVKGGDGQTQDDLCERFHKYYATHTNKTVHFFYDATGNHATGHTKLTRAEQVITWLNAHGWRVIPQSVRGTNPRHFEKYQLWRRILEEKDPRFPRFRINTTNANTTFVSMSRAKTKAGLNGEIKKDKSSERVDNPQREFATDLSDALDNIVFTIYNPLMRGFGGMALPDSKIG